MHNPSKRRERCCEGEAREREVLQEREREVSHLFLSLAHVSLVPPPRACLFLASPSHLSNTPLPCISLARLPRIAVSLYIYRLSLAHLSLSLSLSLSLFLSLSFSRSLSLSSPLPRRLTQADEHLCTNGENITCEQENRSDSMGDHNDEGGDVPVQKTHVLHRGTSSVGPRRAAAASSQAMRG